MSGRLGRASRHRFERISFNKYSLDRRFFFTNVLFDAVDGGLELPDIKPVPKSNVDVEQHLFGTELHRQQIADLFDRGILPYDFFDSFDSCPIGSLSEQQGSALPRQKYRYGGKQ